MLTTQTLVGIACLIANKGPIDTTGIEAQLGQQEKIAIESIIQSGTCLPENLEKLLRETEIKIQNGEIESPASKSMPTDGCF
ncbi:MAG: hypothetical protein KF789_02515 [Bdellovibrionaceae bacterium]|nr:hypothetical protein [Pseudobdellovibrionaceae bacterium]